MIEKIKEAIETTVFFIVAIYMFIALTIAGPYFTWKDIQGSNSFLRYITISPIVGWFQGIAWPYYLYEQNEESKNIVIIKTKVKNLEYFVAGKQYLVQTMIESQFITTKMLEELLKSKDRSKSSVEGIFNKADFSNVNKLLKLSKASFDKCDNNVLNSVNPNLSYIKNSYLTAIEYYNQGLKPGLKLEQASGKFEKADSILSEINTLFDKASVAGLDI